MSSTDMLERRSQIKDGDTGFLLRVIVSYRHFALFTIIKKRLTTFATPRKPNVKKR